jgi:hypothetical protein
MLAAAGTASGATIPASAAARIQSAQSDGGNLYWFQRYPSYNDFYYGPRGKKPSNGEIFMRKLGGGPVERIFKPKDGRGVIAFKVRAGRVLVGLYAEKSETSSVEELTRTGTGWTLTPLISRSAKRRGADCGGYALLSNINSSGEVIVDDQVFEGAAGDCAIVRKVSRNVAISRDGSRRALLARKSGWATSSEELSLEGLTAGPGNWYLTNRYEYDEASYKGVQNLETGVEQKFPDVAADMYNAELAVNGAVLMSDPWSRRSSAIVFIDPSNLTQYRTIRRRGSTAWFHACEDKIIEISHRHATRKRRSAKSWNVWVRDLEGNVLYKLSTRLAKGTAFEGCNASNAFFHHALRHGRVRQSAVSLTTPGPTSATGATGLAP